MNQLATRESGQIVQTDASSIMEVISRAAADPTTDVDKLERLLGLYERITAQQAKAAYTGALAELQPKLPVIDQKGEIRHGDNKPVQSRYAKYEDINDAIRPLLHEHGFALSFRIHRTEAMVSVTGVLAHRDGHSEDTTIDLPADGSGSKNAVQAVGSSITYGKRYAAIALLNITSRAPGDRDDDGEAATTSRGRLGAAAQHAVAEINACETAAELVLWKKNKAGGLSNIVTPAELKEVIATFNRRVEAKKQERNDDAG